MTGHYGSHLRGLFDDIAARIPAPPWALLTDAHAADEEKIAETVDILTQFVRPEGRKVVRAQIVEILRREAISTEDD